LAVIWRTTLTAAIEGSSFGADEPLPPQPATTTVRSAATTASRI
jgi:hypothetical protein